jgi:hypothetical protein
MIFIVVIACPGKIAKPEKADIELVSTLVNNYGPNHVLVCLSQLDSNSELHTKENVKTLVSNFRAMLNFPPSPKKCKNIIPLSLMEECQKSLSKDELEVKHKKLRKIGVFNVEDLNLHIIKFLQIERQYLGPNFREMNPVSNHYFNSNYCFR